MAKSTNMKDGLAIEALFEKNNMPAVIQALAPYMTVRDLTDNAVAQAEGFDYLGTLTPELRAKLSSPHKPMVSRLELKADTNAPVNVCAEYLSQVHTRSKRLVPGWLLTSNANWLLYGFVKSRELLAVPMVGFRQYAAQRAPSAKATSRFNDKPGYFSYCSLIPLKDILRNVAGARLFKIGPVEGEAPSRRCYSALAELGPLIAAFPGGVVDFGKGGPFDLGEYPLSASHRQWMSEEGQKKLCQILAQLRKNDITDKKDVDAHQIEASLYA